jgi:hypothetical protein
LPAIEEVQVSEDRAGRAEILTRHPIAQIDVRYLDLASLPAD